MIDSKGCGYARSDVLVESQSLPTITWITLTSYPQTFGKVFDFSTYPQPRITLDIHKKMGKIIVAREKKYLTPDNL